MAKRHWFKIVLCFLLVSCNPQKRINKLIDKNPEAFEQILKQRVKADVEYITDTLFIYGQDRIDTVIQERRVEVPKIEFIKERTAKEKRLDARLQKAIIKRYEIGNDSLTSLVKERDVKIKLLEQKIKQSKEETKKLKKENRTKLLQFLSEWWWLILLIALIIIFLPNVLKWFRAFKK